MCFFHVFSGLLKISNLNLGQVEFRESLYRRLLSISSEGDMALTDIDNMAVVNILTLITRGNKERGSPKYVEGLVAVFSERLIIFRCVDNL
jgi:hypothetical protein